MKKGVEKDVTRELRFLDSFRFMPSSLDKLSKNLQRDQFINLKKYFGNEKKFGLVHRKGVFPYDYVDGLEKLKKLKEEKLPPDSMTRISVTRTIVMLKRYGRNLGCRPLETVSNCTISLTC